MKKNIIHHLTAGLLLLIAMGCSDKEYIMEPFSDKAKFLSFGFYAQDNPFLDEDFIADNISGSLVIRIPEFFDRTALKARFTVPESCRVQIRNSRQISGVSANDFSYPIDYIVTDTVANLSQHYTVTVGKVLMKWELLGVYHEPDYTSGGSCAMAVNPIDRQPYLFYQHTMASPANKGSVVKWDGTGFVRVGAPQFTAGRIYQPDITFGSDGTPYVFYADNATTPANKPTVMKYSHGDWSTVGSAGYGDAMNTSSGSSFVVTDEGHFLSFYMQNSAGGGVDRRSLNVAYNTTGSWSANNALPGLPAVSGTTNAVYNPRAVAYGNTVYMAVTLNGTGYGVYKYENSSWSTLTAGYLIPGASGINIRDLSIAVDPKGVPYVAIPDNSAENAVWKIQVIKYSNNNWVKVGNLVDADVSAGRFYAMAIDKYGIPYVVFRKKVGDVILAQVVSLDHKTLQWSEPVTLDEIETSTERVFIDFDPEGIGYALFVAPAKNGSTNYSQYHLYRFGVDDTGESDE